MRSSTIVRTAGLILAVVFTTGYACAQGSPDQSGGGMPPGFGGPGGGGGMPGPGGSGMPPAPSRDGDTRGGIDNAVATIDPGEPWSPGETADPVPVSRISLQDVRDDVEEFFQSRGYEKMVVDRVLTFDMFYYVVVSEKGARHAATELLVFPYTGRVIPSPGPATSWNTRYGIRMGRQGSANASDLRLPEKELEKNARAYLSAAGGGYTLGPGEEFYGYRTYEFTKHGRIAGLLGVSERSGRVWLYSWLGAFVK